MGIEDYRIVMYRNQPEGWVAEIPCIPGCYALMTTREQALAELEQVFETIAAEYVVRGVSLPEDSTRIVGPVKVDDHTIGERLNAAYSQQNAEVDSPLHDAQMRTLRKHSS